MKDFGKILKNYLLVALEKSGARVDGDTHAELDAMVEDLESHIDHLVSESMKTHIRIHHRSKL